MTDHVWFTQRYTGLMFKSAKFAMVEESAQKALTDYLAEANIDIENYDVDVTYSLVPRPFVSDGL